MVISSCLQTHEHESKGARKHPSCVSRCAWFRAGVRALLVSAVVEEESSVKRWAAVGAYFSFSFFWQLSACR